ncbi:MAG: family 78 glycoside hydrolase catalytic domain, partial [Armatimonadota bacterium]
MWVNGWRGAVLRMPMAFVFVALTLVLEGFAKMAEGVTVERLRCEYAVNPVGIDVPRPRLSWTLRSNRRGERQTAYQILVATSMETLNADSGDLWDSGKVDTDQSIHVPYSGRELTSRTRCYWKVRVWDKDGKPSRYSQPAYWEMGLLRAEDWKAKWIAFPPPAGKEKEMGPCPYLRREFALAKPVRRARLYATALGLYEVRLNGRRVGDHVFAPGWTDYKIRVQYQTYDVTSLVREGRNAIGAVLGDGWYAGHVGLGGRNRYGPYPTFMCQLEVEYTDGTTETIVTDDTWRASHGPILASDMLMGETYDARREIPGWDTPGFDDSKWSQVTVRDVSGVRLVAQVGPPVRRIQELKPKTVSEPVPGSYVFDLGQNMVGWARLKVKGEAGTTVTLRFAEMLNPDGTIYTANYRSAKCTDHYTLKGGAEEVYEPLFTFRGFRYVEVTGYPGKPGLDAITGVVVHSDTPPTGKFECSSPMLNQLHSNIVWGQKGNFLSVPTDCPQRDERLGWTGDAQIFARTAAFNMDVAGFFTKWMIDVEDAQWPNGAFTDVAPFVAVGAGVAAWGDAGVICPWTMYLAYADKGMVERHYAAMAKWIDYLKSNSTDLLRPAEGYG